MKTTNPKLSPGVRFYERGQTHIQIGINPSSALVINKQVGQVVAKLLTGAHSTSEICKQLALDGHDIQSSENFLHQLFELGLVEPGPVAAT